MEAKLWATQVFELTKMKGNLQQTSLFNTTELCSHSKPSQDWPSLHLDAGPLVQISTVLLEKQTVKADHSKVAYFEYEIYY